MKASLLLTRAAMMAATASLACASGATAGVVRLSAPSCATSGGEIVVDIIVDPEGATVVGLQALLRYDASKLRFVGFEAGDSPYVLPIYNGHVEASAEIDVAVGFDPASGSLASPVAVAKRIRFQVLPSVPACAPAEMVAFRSEPPFETMLTDLGGGAVATTLAALGAVNVAPAPAISGADATTVVPAAGTNCTPDSIVAPTATTACGTAPTLSFVRSDGFTSLTSPVCRLNSPITVTWTATDSCGRQTTVAQVITVPGMTGDFDGDAHVSSHDLSVVLASWGLPGGNGDINGDQTVDGVDLSMLLARWTGNAP